MTDTSTPALPAASLEAPPAGHSPDWDAGYEAGLAAARVPAIAAPAAAPSPTITVSPLVPATADLLPILMAAANGAAIKLSPVDYHLSDTPVIKAKNLSLALNGARLFLWPKPGATSDIVVQGENFTCFGGTIARGVVAFRSYATGTFLHDLVVLGVDGKSGDGVNTFFLADVGSDGWTLGNLTVGATNSVTVYATASGQILGGDYAGSIGEDCIRIDRDAAGKNPKAVNLLGVSVANVINAFGKEAVSYRSGSGAVAPLIANGKSTPSVITGYARAGQREGTVPGSNATVAFHQVRFPVIVRGNNHIAAVAGVALTADSCDFAADDEQTSIGVGANSAATITACRRIRVSAGLAVKPGIWSTAVAAGAAGHPVVVESGTTVVDPAPAPAK